MLDVVTKGLAYGPVLSFRANRRPLGSSFKQVRLPRSHLRAFVLGLRVSVLPVSIYLSPEEMALVIPSCVFLVRGAGAVLGIGDY